MRVLGSLVALLLATVILIFSVGAFTGGAPGLAYVESGSMGATLEVGDGFFVWPAPGPKPGDIIVFRPLKLEATRVTHRIVEVSGGGFITQGDAVDHPDQAVGEPPVTPDRIIGKALVWRDRPLRISGVGPVAADLRENLGDRVRVLALALVGLGAVLFVWDAATGAARRRRRGRSRPRLGHLFRWAAAGISLVLIVATVLGSRVHTVEYLVSQNPGTRTDHVQLGEPGTVELRLDNRGLVPVWHFSRAVPPATIGEAPAWLAPLSTARLELVVPATDQPGWYRAYVQVYHYPMVLPRGLLADLHAISPLLAVNAVVASQLLLLFLVFQLFDGWVPLAALRGGVLGRRLRRLRQTFFPRGRF